MSGGHWNYQQYKLEEIASLLDENRSIIVEIIKTAAESEHIIDWAESGDTVRRRDEDGSGEEKDLYELWLKTFQRLYGE